MRKLALAVAASFVLASSAQAAVVQVTSEGALGPDDSVDWAQLGPEFTPVPSGTTAVSGGGITMTLTDSVDDMLRYDQSSGWSGNFAPGDTLLQNNFDGSITITFDTAVRGVGAQVQQDIFGAFTSTIMVNGGALGTFMLGGTSTSDADDSAIFHGVLSDAADITSITFLNDPGASFALGNLSLVAGVIPEPATWALMILGFGAVGGAMRRREKVATRVTYA